MSSIPSSLQHFAEFCEQYNEKYAATYGMYRIERNQTIGERFSTCGDYLQGVARIRCANPECGLVGAAGRSLLTGIADTGG